ncbi:MAG: OmpA family protein [Saprospirales bacterium]|nr:OmpA family protein [Saprospirales bacterium]
MQIRLFFLSMLATLAGFPLFGQEVFDSTFTIDQVAVFFDVNAHELQPGADSILQSIADKCRTTSRRFLRIEAHTDAAGGDEFNEALSERRAETVRRFFEAHGISPEQMKVVPFGERRPVASNQTEGGKQLNRRATVELWQRTQMTWLAGQVVDAETKEGIQATVAIRSRFLTDSLETDTVGFFRTPVPDRIPLEVTVYAPGYFFETQTLVPNSLEPIKVTLPLPPALEGEVLTLKNFYFVGNQDTLLPKSEPELPKLLKFMQFNPDIRIEIAGHINLPNNPPVSKDSWNYGLSVRRAKRVFMYLLEHGIDQNRMTFQGYGNYEMIYPRARTLEEQALNRRVEIHILENPSLQKRRREKE